MENNENKDFGERPLECHSCKKVIKVRYTEIVGNEITHTVMCGECPQLQLRLKGTKAFEPSKLTESAKMTTGLSCGVCGTTFEAIRRGELLGCSSCYKVFSEVIFNELKSREKVFLKKEEGGKPKSLHVGRVPGQITSISPSAKLIALQEALNESLKLEDYEQAAFLRDQIKEIEEMEDEKKN